MAIPKHLNYIPYPTPMEFHSSIHLFLRAICGPFGSGKSVTCVEELLFIAMRQKPAADNVRYTKMGVIRATYPSLKSTTKKTMEMWYPSECGSIKETVPLEGRYRIPLPDGTIVNMELLLISAQDEGDVSKLRSTDFTAIWINEATEVSVDVLSAAIERVGRYPSDRFGKCTYKGILMDYNKPPSRHWLLDLFSSTDTPDNYGYFEQPPAAFKHESEDGIITYELNPNADNLKVLGDDYYRDQIAGRRLRGDFDAIDQLLCMKVVDSKSGKPVYPMFDKNYHVAKQKIDPIPGQDLLIGIDTSGIHPAAIILQFTGVKWAVTDELYGEESGMEEFITAALVPLLQFRYPGCNVLSICDPANARNGYNATKPTTNLQDNGIRAIVAPTNDPKSRIEAVAMLLGKTTGGLLVSPHCELLIASLSGGYRYRKIKIAGTMDVTYSPQPEKNQHSHPADALQYVALHILRSADLNSGSNRQELQRKLHQRLKRRSRVL